MPQHPNFSPDRRTKAWRLAVLPELYAEVCGGWIEPADITLTTQGDVT